MELIEEVKALLIETEKCSKAVRAACLWHGQYMHWEKEKSRLAEQELGWNRGTIRKGQRELESGIVCLDAYSLRGRKPSRRASAQLAASDITAIVDGQSQADPQFRTNRLYTRLTATEVRRQLIAQYGYRDDALPTAETIATKLNELG
ncbi:MAG TPA: hypothetical protein VF844_12320 [Ktedonobacteraceae bacterium]